jgi:hypothetical protein
LLKVINSKQFQVNRFRLCRLLLNEVHLHLRHRLANHRRRRHLQQLNNLRLMEE